MNADQLKTSINASSADMINNVFITKKKALRTKQESQ